MIEYPSIFYIMQIKALIIKLIETMQKMNLKQKETKDKTPELDPDALLDFADVMENLHSFKEIDLIPKQFIDFLKADEKKVTTMVEYSTGLVCLMEGSLLIYYESIFKYHDNCVAILDFFRKNLGSQIPQSWRNELTKYTGNKSFIMGKIAEAKKQDPYLQDFQTQKYLYSLDLASRILMCYNGEFNQCFSSRIDLILLGQVQDFEKELSILKLIHMRFKKSSIAWHYRKIVFMVAFSRQLERLNERISSVPEKKAVSSEDFIPLKQFWLKEKDRLDDIINKFGRSYKVWEYYIHITGFMVDELLKFPLAFSEQTLGESLLNETEIFTIEAFIGFYEYVRDLARKNIHNHCIFVLLTNTIKLLFKLKIDLFMDTKDFYVGFIRDHNVWIDEMRTYYRSLYKGLETPMEMDRYKLESLESHFEEVRSFVQLACPESLKDAPLNKSGIKVQSKGTQSSSK